MRYENQLLPGEARPAADKALAMLEEVDGAFKLIVPAGVRDLALRLINGHKGPRQQQGIHEPIFGSDQGVALFLEIERLKKQERQLTPTLNHASKISCTAEVEAGIQRQGQQHFARNASMSATSMKTKHVRLRDIHGQGVGRKGAEGDPIPFENLLKVQPIDRAQRIQLVDGGN